jgi:hypothetical protein
MPTYSQPSTVPGYGVEFLGDPCASVHLNPVSTNVSGASEVAANTTSDPHLALLLMLLLCPDQAPLSPRHLRSRGGTRPGCQLPRVQLPDEDSGHTSGRPEHSSSEADLPAPGSRMQVRETSTGNHSASTLPVSLPVAPGSGTSSAQLVPTRPGTRLQHGIRKPMVYTLALCAMVILTSTGDEPHDHHEALCDSKWKNAMDQELDALVKNKTWHLVPQ